MKYVCAVVYKLIECWVVLEGFKMIDKYYRDKNHVEVTEDPEEPETEY